MGPHKNRLLAKILMQTHSIGFRRELMVLECNLSILCGPQVSCLLRCFPCLGMCERALLVFNSLPHNKILDWSKLKAFADDKLNATEKLKFVLGRVENIVGKGENAGYQHFLLFPQCFQKPSLSGSLKVGIVW